MWSVTDSSQHICFLRHIKISIFSLVQVGSVFTLSSRSLYPPGESDVKKMTSKIGFWGWNQFIILPLVQTSEIIHSFYCFQKISICFHQIVHLLLRYFLCARKALFWPFPRHGEKPLPGKKSKYFRIFGDNNAVCLPQYSCITYLGFIHFITNVFCDGGQWKSKKSMWGIR